MFHFTIRDVLLHGLTVGVTDEPVSHLISRHRHRHWGTIAREFDGLPN